MPEPISAAQAADEPDYGHLLRSNLERVFNEPDPARRASAIADLFVAEPILYEPADIVRGRAAISEIAGGLLDRFGPDFRFRPDGDVVGHHGLATLRWQAGPAGGPAMVTGTDAAEIVGGRIAQLWVLLDPAKP
ncbi:nuclear transport factor 2 family protein [Azospirillum picis]|uniref:SnoaL-like domain-containing protein n=1 Tax=Azospirillum picis TaxID=488438 RepID=A0ABU0MMH4_9PROT|nr:nuclear transport factor 2 family protein [Azospirillum picis]MBP2300703.1 hypothetical protein [Azospirillum picis]MDQ0534672.1 hypothetical protein [Azospirillum picis]